MNNLKPHIGIFGRRNNGKSSIINRLTGQDVAIVSPTAGTTTDPVRKSIEIFGIGPVVIIDTAGIDDTGELGLQRVEKSLQIMNEIDCAILVVVDNEFDTVEENVVSKLRENNVPFAIVHNKSDINPMSEDFKASLEKKFDTDVVAFSAEKSPSDDIVSVLKKLIPESAFTKNSLLGGIVNEGDTVVLVCPIDAEAPEGRMILPQVMAIRDALDNECVCVVLKETALENYLRVMPRPNLVVTDSQVFNIVNKIVPQDIPLTSFSILLARMRGDFAKYVEGTPYLSKLDDGDAVLILESCTHQISCSDIGRVKLPNLIRKFTGKNISFEYVAGMTPIENIEKYAMAIQCGGCVVTRKQLINRTNIAVKAGVPISNYGMSIAYMTGIWDRVLGVFTI